MADLFERLFPDFESGIENIPVHAFTAAITDYIAGETTEAQIVSAWNLDSEAQADLTTLIAAIDGIQKKADKVVFALEFDGVCLLAEAGLKYTTKSAFANRLGLV